MTNQLMDEFVAAFNKRDLAGLMLLLAEEATAEVLGSGFGTERGPNDIAGKSLAHMLDESGSKLTAERFGEHILFLNDGKLDTAATIKGDGRITRIEYYVVWFRGGELNKIAAERGIEVAPAE